MCGIIGCVGVNDTAEVLLDSLGRLEYRGYDSAGIALACSDGLKVIKSHDRVYKLKELVPSRIYATAGIGHTRWATHGKPSDINAHPHTDCTGNIAVAHNGIIENYQELKDTLIARGHHFTSETDTEVVAHLLEEHYTGDTERALRETVTQLRGSFALVIINEEEPGRIFAVKKDSPLIIGLGNGQQFIASDVTAFLKYAKNAIFLEDGDIAVLSKNGVTITDFDGNPVSRDVMQIEWSLEAAEKAGYDCYMLKEIHEQPSSLKEAMAGRLNEMAGEVNLKELALTKEDVRGIRQITIVACGTSYHAGIMGKYAIQALTDIPVSVEIGSEFRYTANRLGPDTLVIALSQSGETADTLAAVKEAMKKGAHVIAVTNITGSSIAREAEYTVYMKAGPEIGVAATKTFTSQIVIMYMIAINLGRAKGTLNAEDARKFISELKALPRHAQKVLDMEGYIARTARVFMNSDSFFFVGRSLNYPIALEGSLKLKEISYIFSEGFAAGELKHGPLALITTNVPVVAIATKCPTYDKMISNIKEIKARDASVIAIASESDESIEQFVDLVIRIPDVSEYISPVLSAIVLQLFAYYIATGRGCPVDKPRNLAKSVTVE